MKIKELILEGFKSYSERTTLSDLDPQFNAITGLNGSGKSNILEAICFVLGLQSWTLARVQHLRELIYKDGQAGIRQASVTVVFCNKDKGSSPVGLEEFDEVKITRVIKHDLTFYYLNAKKTPNNRVRAIFKSIGLNIDNYNTFFVQQGRIVSIVNFHPRDLMGFIEETAGVSYYNQVKGDCMTTLERKDNKLRQVEEMCEGEIRPDLEHLEREVENLRAWKKNEAELQKLVVRQRHFEKKIAKGEIEKLEAEARSLEERLQQLRRAANEAAHRLREVLKDLQLERPEDVKFAVSSDEHRKLRERLDKQERELARAREVRRRAEDEIKAQEVALFRNRTSRDSIQEAQRNLQWKAERAKENLERVKFELENLKFVSTQNNEKVGDYLQKNLSDLKDEIASEEGQLLRIAKQIGLEERNLENLSYQKNQTELYQQNHTKSLNEKEAKKAAILKEIERLEFQKTDEDQIRRKLNELEAKLSDSHQRRKQLVNNNFSSFEISWANNRGLIPEKSVFGRIHSLFSVRNKEFLNALETIAGAKLHFIVVENEDVSQRIIERGVIRGRNEFIPNNKISSKGIDPRMLALAKSIADRMGEQIWNPLELVDFPRELARTFDFVFGDKLICSSLDLAKEIAFHPEIRRVCVTKDGDSVNPSGLLEGGYVPEQVRFLPRAIRFREIGAEIDRLQRAHEEVEREVQRSRENAEELKKAKGDLSDLRENIEELRTKISEYKLGELGVMLDNLKKKIVDLRLEEQAKRQTIEGLKSKTESLRSDISLKGSDKAKILQNQICKQTQEVEAGERGLQRLAQDQRALRLELESCGGEEKEVLAELEALRTDLGEKAAKAEELARQREALVEQMRSSDEKLQEMQRQRQKVERRQAELNNERADVEAEVQRLAAEQEEKSAQLKRNKELVQEFRQKVFERTQRLTQESFEEEEGELPALEIMELLRSMTIRRELLEKEQQALEKRVRKDCDTEFAQLRTRFQQLSAMTAQVSDNRRVILDNITGLDEKKKAAIELCFAAVNKNLGLIFSSLLPGAFAEMQMVELLERRTQQPYPGIEIRICFNGKWKDSLSELSGGQRSLLALSFLLAMLRYRPAPFYILDEVDAALDLSHTENLGALISRHFPQSQFLVISLKDELFNNANVLFKTSISEGRSRIERFNMKTINNFRMD